MLPYFCVRQTDVPPALDGLPLNYWFVTDKRDWFYRCLCARFQQPPRHLRMPSRFFAGHVLDALQLVDGSVTLWLVWVLPCEQLFYKPRDLRTRRRATLPLSGRSVRRHWTQHATAPAYAAH